ncbi:hypothetical protein [Legionella worsleiensis]|uniref:Coiled-coil protein n=1 Tax=Legionella worsleiensis TaxID=45076 RepID=A0A0W1AF26_9GAMM|nr:hypothetical protein [Legionella worsleiensis]KTD79876.1 coiled-coil protein [Legionella worsleiensis]STY32388.1 coiled-coil protein [Legionella worsleiensis]
MRWQVELSDRSQQLIKKLADLRLLEAIIPGHSAPSLDASQLVLWLADDIDAPDSLPKYSKKQFHYTLALLRAELLSDLLAAMPHPDVRIEKKESSTSVTNQNKLILLAIAGTLLAACEGFDSIISLLSALSIPALVTLVFGVFFSILSVVVFYGFDLVQVVQNLGFKFRDTPKLSDIYLAQINEIKAIRRKINAMDLTKKTLSELEIYGQIIFMLQKRLNWSVQASKQFEKALYSEKIIIVETIVSWVAGIMFFGGGYFAGQSVAIFVLELFMAVVSPTFLPVVLFSLGIGLAAFCIYWNVERAGIKQLITSWFGLDEENIEKLCDSANMANQEQKLEHLLERVSSTKELINEIALLRQTTQDSALKNTCKLKESIITKEDGMRIYAMSSNSYFFHPKRLTPLNETTVGEQEPIPTYSRH